MIHPITGRLSYHFNGLPHLGQYDPGETSDLAFTQTNRSIRILEATLSRSLSTPCGTRGGQVGGGPEGSNFSPCDPITGDSLKGVVGSWVAELDTQN